MPEPRTARRADRPPTNARQDKEKPQDSADKLKGPMWARSVHLFYDPIFDIRSRAAFQAALDDYITLPERERAFHDTHLLFRALQGMEAIYGVLTRIEARLSTAGSADLSALEHLAPMRAALDEIVHNQARFVQVDGLEGEDGEEQDEDEDEDEDELGDDPDEGRDLDKDPDFIYDTVPDEEPERTPRSRRPAPEPAPRSARAEQPRQDAARPEPRPEPTRPAARPADPEREALVGELVPASDGPHGAEAGDR